MRVSPIPLVATLSLLTTFDALAVRPVRYVKANAPNGGTGQTWAMAYNKLQDALAAAQAGDDIWVALGTYYPDQGGGAVNDDRNSTFALKNDVAIYGGFSGTNTAFSSRDPQVYVTTLHGDISSSPVFHTDRAFHVVTGTSVNNTAILDGFTITEGNADFVTEPNSSGAGLICFFGSPKIVNCVFTANTSLRLGGAVHLEYASTPSFTNCTFFDNSVTDRAGGAVYASGATPSFVGCSFTSNTSTGDGAGLNLQGSNATVTNCVFTGNASTRQGGGILLYSSPATITGCTFSQNTATAKGGAIFAERSNYSLSDCSFSQNSSGFGAAVFNYGSSPTVSNCSFTQNTASEEGGAMSNTQQASDPVQNSSPNLTSCTFSANTAGKAGALYFTGGETNPSTPAITNCTFTSNTVTGTGGAIQFSNCSPQITGSSFVTNSSGTGNAAGAIDLSYVVNAVIGNCTFNGNQAGFGGAINLSVGSLSVTGSTFNANSTTSSAGAVFLGSQDVVSFSSCSFTGNTSAYAGAVSISGSSSGNFAPTWTNCKFLGNSATYNSGAVYSSNAAPVFQSCVVSGNSSSGSVGAIFIGSSLNPASFTNVTVSGNSSSRGGALQFNSNNPLLANTVIYNNRCSPGSTGISPDDSINTEISSTPTFTYCLVANFSKASLDTGASPDTNFEPLDPKFVTPIDPASAPTVAGNLALKLGSPAIDAGSNALLSLTLDILGNPRVSNSIIDLGAFENQGPDPFFGDVDGDGISAGLELALGTNPSLSDPANARNLRILPSTITFGYDAATAPTTALELRRSTDLINFNVVVASSLTGFPAAGPGGIISITDPTRPAGKAFYRLQATPR